MQIRICATLTAFSLTKAAAVSYTHLDVYKRQQYGNPDIQFKYRTITGVKGVSVKPEHLILDGQQRLTSIYQATSLSLIHI